MNFFCSATWDICVNDILCEDPGTEDFLVQTKENNICKKIFWLLYVIKNLTKATKRKKNDLIITFL